MRIERLDRLTRSRRLIPGAIVVVALIFAVIWRRLDLPLPECALRAATGVPCPTCGSTRLLEALGEGDPIGAAAANPLVFAAIVLMILWAVASAAGWRVVATRVERRILAGIGTVIVVTGWGYSIWRGG